MTNLWKNEYQNWNAFYTPDIPHSLKIQMIFCCTRCDTRTELFNFWSFRCRKGSKNFVITCFQKLMWFYLLATKDRLLGKVWGKTLFRCEMPWTALTEIPTQISPSKQITTTTYNSHVLSGIELLIGRYSLEGRSWVLPERTNSRGYILWTNFSLFHSIFVEVPP